MSTRYLYYEFVIEHSLLFLMHRSVFLSLKSSLQILFLFQAMSVTTTEATGSVGLPPAAVASE